MKHVSTLSHTLHNLVTYLQFITNLLACGACLLVCVHTHTRLCSSQPYVPCSGVTWILIQCAELVI